MLPPTTTITDDAEGFAQFYRMLFRRDIPLHAFRWIKAIYAAHRGDVPHSATLSNNSNAWVLSPRNDAAHTGDVPYSAEPSRNSNAWVLSPRNEASQSQSKGMIIEAFRGSSKTTTITIAFLAFRLGLSPHDSFLVLQATGAAARVTCRQVADLIEHNVGWRVAFPAVVPDKKLSWSMSRGFEVKRTDMDYAAWRQLCAENKGRDPSFIGLGYRSSFVVGLHPTGMLLADDIHNETNTRSVKEMDKAVAIITSNILPTLNPRSWKVFIGTPWRPGDVLQYLKATGTYAAISTPIYTEVPIEDSVGAGSPRPPFSAASSQEHPSPELNLPSSTVGAQHTAPAPSDVKPSGESLLGDSRVDSPTRCEATQSPRPSNDIKPSGESSLGGSRVDSPTRCEATQAAPAPSDVKPSGEPSPRSEGTQQIKNPQSQIKNVSAVDPEPSTSNLQLTWPDRFPLPVIQNYRLMLGEREFARMYLLDLSAAEGIHLKAEWLHKVDSANIQPTWPVIMGVDYASTADKQRDTDRDYFAVAIGRAQPAGSGVILIDGFRGRLSLAEAQDKLLELVAFYPNTEVIGVEAVGKGEEFYHSLSSHPNLPIVSMHPGGQGKGPRFQNAMAPLFERGWARITDAESPFLHVFRHEWLRWPWGDHDDTLDATYWMLRAGQYHLPPRKDKPRVASPFTHLGRT